MLKKLAPITLRASAGVSTVDGSHPPAARTMTIPLLLFNGGVRNATIPKIAGGSGSGRLIAHATVRFDDGTSAAGSVLRQCKGR